MQFSLVTSSLISPSILNLVFRKSTHCIYWLLLQNQFVFYPYIFIAQSLPFISFVMLYAAEKISFVSKELNITYVSN
jgi:hypothetical protein